MAQTPRGLLDFRWGSKINAWHLRGNWVPSTLNPRNITITPRSHVRSSPGSGGCDVGAPRRHPRIAPRLPPRDWPLVLWDLRSFPPSNPDRHVSPRHRRLVRLEPHEVAVPRTNYSQLVLRGQEPRLEEAPIDSDPRPPMLPATAHRLRRAQTHRGDVPRGPRLSRARSGNKARLPL